MSGVVALRAAPLISVGTELKTGAPELLYANAPGVTSPVAMLIYKGLEPRLLASAPVAAVQSVTVVYRAVVERAPTKFKVPPGLLRWNPLLFELISAVVEALYKQYFAPVPGEAILIKLFLKFTLLRLPEKYAPYTVPVVVAVELLRSNVLW
jgi:hypothetical protein